MRRKFEKGFSTFLIILAIVVAVGGAATATYYVKKSADENRLKETAQLEAAKLALEDKQRQEANREEDTKLAEKPAETEKQPDANPSCDERTKMYISVPEGHALRSEKALDATKIVAVPFRGEVSVGCDEDGWYSAEYEGKVGFAYGEFLSGTQPAEQATGDMSQDKCSTVTELYTVKTETPVYRFSEDGKVVSTGVTVPDGTAIAGGECAMWDGKEVPGYWQRGAKLFSFGDLSQTKP